MTEFCESHYDQFYQYFTGKNPDCLPEINAKNLIMQVLAACC